MNCPACNKIVKVLVDVPVTFDITSTVTNSDTYLTSDVAIPPKNKETYKCVNEKCWATRIEVDWGQS